MGLAKEVNGMKHVTLFHEQSKIELRPAQAYSNYVDEYKLTVNGQKVELQKGVKITLQSSQEQVTVYWSNDNTVINTPNTRLVHSGKTVTVEEKAALMVPTVVSVVIITWTKELMSSPPRDVSSPLTGLLHNLTDPNQVNAHLFLLRH